MPFFCNQVFRKFPLLSLTRKVRAYRGIYFGISLLEKLTGIPMSLASVQLVESTCEAVLDHLLLSLLLSLLVLTYRCLMEEVRWKMCQSLLKISLVYTFSATSSRQES